MNDGEIPKSERRSHDLIVQSEHDVFDTGRFEHMWRIAQYMAQAELVPTHFQGKPYNCLMVVQQAARWRLDPFMVAQKTHVINGRLGYEAQLVTALINSSPIIKRRLWHTHQGEGSNLTCTVYGELKGDPPNFIRAQQSPMLGRIKIKNSPLWDVDPKQQLLYWTQRAWVRANASDLLLGVYTPEELESGIAEDSTYSIEEVKPPPAPRIEEFEPPPPVVGYELHIIDDSVFATYPSAQEYYDALLRYAEQMPSHIEAIQHWNKAQIDRLPEAMKTSLMLIFEALQRLPEAQPEQVPPVPEPPPPPPATPPPPPPPAQQPARGKEWVVYNGDGTPIFKTMSQQRYRDELLAEARKVETRAGLDALWQTNRKVFVTFQDEIGNAWDPIRADKKE